ncbi:hypothetical protein [Pantanalinema sp. GBBB05]|uniref:hypothetical protein n=1 Tax=Pantanalinema sp. GBBB05 TaxID=2604139 RepID=UPI001DAE59FA|nr:hypothetical protein [Pantanalinema sp. GBBB05]
MSTTSIILGCDLQVGDYVESVTEEPLFSDTHESIPIGVSVTLHCRRQNKKFSQTIASKPPNTPRPPVRGAVYY